jgi:hypothetical protein
VKTPPDGQIPPVVADNPAPPSDGDYRVPHAGNTWEQADESAASGRVAIFGCLGLALLLLGPVCILIWVLSNVGR